MAGGLERPAGAAAGPFVGWKDQNFGCVLRYNWETRISKLDKCVATWKKRSLSLIGKGLVLNILELSKLLFVSSILTPIRWVCDHVNSII